MWRRWRTGLLAAFVGLSAFGWFAWSVIRERQVSAELVLANGEIAKGRYAQARRRLGPLAASVPGRGEVEYLLGLCEAARGRMDAAQAAWARVPATSAFTGRALLMQARELQNRGRYTEAEEMLRTALAKPGPQQLETQRGLISLLRLEGRSDEVPTVLTRGPIAASDPLTVVLELMRLESDPFPTEGATRLLEQASRTAPDDERVWLGRADLARRLGRFDEAERWLSACERGRLRDAPVWHARVRLAQASGRLHGLEEALGHIPAAGDDATQVPLLRAWLAERRSDRKSERAALEERLGNSPSDTTTIERLAELNALEGRTAGAAALRRRKADLDRTRQQYVDSLGLDDPRTRASELAELARTLGREFDVRVWSRFAGAAATFPKRQETRSVRTLADVLRSDLERTRRVAGGVVEHVPRVAFRDDADAAGLRFTFANGRSPQRQLPETMSGGVGLLDYDGDGWLDVYVVQGGSFPGGVAPPEPGDRLFRNTGEGRFEDVTEHSGLAVLSRGYGHGVAVGDYDNDGDPDLFVTRWRAYALYRNRGDGTFEDATSEAGLGGDRDWPTSAALADLEGDGDLDLYVCHYLAWDAEHSKLCTDERTHNRFYCNPRDFASQPDHLFRNDNGHFVDVSHEAGIVDPHGRGLGVVAADLDGDGRVDLFVANDMSANYLFRNLGGLRFEEVALAAGVSCNAEGGSQAGMGVACGDFDGNGLPDLVVTNFYGESTSLFLNLGQGGFAERSAAAGLGAASRYLLGFGACALDANSDGILDLLTANGHVNDGRPYFPWMMPAQVLLGMPGGRLMDASRAAGEPFLVPHLGRGLASGDLDHDGRTDVLLLGQNEPIVYLHNRTDGGQTASLRLVGTASNRDAVGAVATVTVGGRRQVAFRLGGGSYQSASAPQLHVGLGSATRFDVEVRWPSGRVERWNDLRAGVEHPLREGGGSL
jgi:tetratricopeptide (TPR) repeat protein